MGGMSGYTKLFSSILASTVWREDMETRIVWITLLAMAGKNGVAEGSVPGLADFARVSVEGTRRALVKLSSPDPDSRTHENDGRRIEAVDGGWLLLNHAKYRAKLSEEERREYQRLWQAKHRKAKSTPVDNVDTRRQMSGNVDRVDTSRSRVQKQSTEAEAPRARQVPTPIAPRMNANVAFAGRPNVPAFLHVKFRAKLVGPEDECDQRLRDWYGTTADAWADRPIGDDDIRFWEARFREWLGTTVTPVHAGQREQTKEEFAADVLRVQAERAARQAARS